MQLETAVNWGRYAELFDFDAARRRFVQSEHTNAEGVDETVESAKESEEETLS
jgi:NitT/TauT family transport system ATP-binding protein